MSRFFSKTFRNTLHLLYAYAGALFYWFPSRKMFVIGITGTTGKSTIITLLREALSSRGFVVGSLSTVDFYIAGKKQLNDQKMTMLGRTRTQAFLRKMVSAGCQIAIVETTSEGRLQHRHRGIMYDMMVLTNLYPEHIESHGGYDKYAKAKQDIFAYVASLPKKHLPKMLSLPVAPDGTAPRFSLLRFGVDFASGFHQHGFDREEYYGSGSSFAASDISAKKEGLSFSLSGVSFFAPMYGAHNVENITCVIAICRLLGISVEDMPPVVANFHNVEGRCENIKEAEKYGFRVIVDYAFEPVALQKLYDIVPLFSPKRIIHVCGSTGGGRDASRREPIGSLVGTHADIFYVTDEDPYDEDPQEIMRQVALGAKKVGKEEGKNMWIVPDRKEAIFRAIDVAEEGDLILITGKGSEQAMCVAGGKKIPWDDREIVRDALNKKV